MSQKFDELKQKIQNADTSKAKEIIEEVKQQKQEGNIDENEKNSLIDTAKEKLGGKFGL